MGMSEFFLKPVNDAKKLTNLNGLVSIASMGASVASFIFRDKTKIGSIEIPCTIDEKHTTTLEITDHPVENGSTITDHSFFRPVEIVITGGFSASGSVQSIISNISSMVGKKENNYIQECYNSLLDLQKERQPITIITGLKTYENMLIQELSITRDKNNENILYFSATLREIIIANIQTVTIPKSAQKLVETTQKKVNSGIKQTQKENKKISGLKQLDKSTGGALGNLKGIVSKGIGTLSDIF